MTHSCHVYIMASHTRVLYVGVTNDLGQRILQHKCKTHDSFTRKYNVTRLVWFTDFPDMDQAIEAEKRIKRILRKKKISLIEEMNPLWEDLSEEWVDA
jgi:putative endonuclease